ncbi:MAG: EamA family transporter [Planctomycetes bacterium]|nr:EamA family transporter [Planctomycetota bacterium]
MPWHDVLLAASVPACYALSNTYIKRSLSHLEPIRLTTLTLALAGAVLLPLGLLTEPVRWSDASAGWRAIAALGVLGVVGTGLAMLMFYGLVQRRGPLFAGMVAYLVPVGALLWGGADKEPITPGQVIALAGILAGVALVQWPARPRA